MKARRPITAVRPALACIFLAVATACSDPASPSPDGLQIRAAKPGSACQSPDPCPDNVQPPEGNQGQTLNVIITGTDFGDPGEVCEVNWLLNGKKSSAIQTNSASCTSTTRADANISVAPDAPVDAVFDVEFFVGVGRGRRGGIGSELFVVKSGGRFNVPATVELAGGLVTLGPQPVELGKGNNEKKLKLSGDEATFSNELAMTNTHAAGLLLNCMWEGAFDQGRSPQDMLDLLIDPDQPRGIQVSVPLVEQKRPGVIRIDSCWQESPPAATLICGGGIGNMNDRAFALLDESPLGPATRPR